MTLLQRAQSLSVAFQNETEETIMEKLPQIIVYINDSILENAKHGYKSCTFYISDLNKIQMSNLVWPTETFKTFNYLHTPICRTLLKALHKHYKTEGFRVSDDHDAETNYITFKWS